MVGKSGLEYLKEVSYLDDSGVESLINRVNHPGGSTTVGTGEAVATNM
jgi:hypothetical protein